MISALELEKSLFQIEIEISAFKKIEISLFKNRYHYLKYRYLYSNFKKRDICISNIDINIKWVKPQTDIHVEN